MHSFVYIRPVISRHHVWQKNWRIFLIISPAKSSLSRKILDQRGHYAIHENTWLVWSFKTPRRPISRFFFVGFASRRTVWPQEIDEIVWLFVFYLMFTFTFQLTFIWFSFELVFVCC